MLYPCATPNETLARSRRPLPAVALAGDGVPW
jgi:hypothetical protein